MGRTLLRGDRRRSSVTYSRISDSVAPSVRSHATDRYAPSSLLVAPQNCPAKTERVSLALRSDFPSRKKKDKWCDIMHFSCFVCPGMSGVATSKKLQNPPSPPFLRKGGDTLGAVFFPPFEKGAGLREPGTGGDRVAEAGPGGIYL